MDVLVLQHIACEPPGVYEEVLLERTGNAPPCRARRGRTAAGLARVRRDRRDGWADERERRRRSCPGSRRRRTRSQPRFGPARRTGAHASACSCSRRASAPASIPDRSRRSASSRCCSPRPPRPIPSSAAAVRAPDAPVARRHLRPPDGAVRLAGSPEYRNQAFRWGERAYGVQFHVEVSVEMAREWAEVPGLRRVPRSRARPRFAHAPDRRDGAPRGGHARERPPHVRAVGRRLRSLTAGAGHVTSETWSEAIPAPTTMPRVDGFRFSTDLRVRFNETDAQGIVHNSAYLVWFEIARIDYLARFPGGYKGMVEDHGVDVTTVESHVRYRAPTRFDDQLRVWARTDELRGTRFRFDYVIENLSESRRRRGGGLDPACLRRREDATTGAHAGLAADALVEFEARRRLSLRKEAAEELRRRGCRDRLRRRLARSRLARGGLAAGPGCPSRPSVAGPALASCGVRAAIGLVVGLRLWLRSHSDDLRLAAIARVPGGVVENAPFGVVDDPPHRRRPRRLTRLLDDPLSPCRGRGRGFASPSVAPSPVSGAVSLTTRRWSGVP